MFKKHRQARFDVLNDPIVQQMMRADGVSQAEVNRLLREVASTLDHAPERTPSRVIVQRAISTAAIVSRLPLA